MRNLVQKKRRKQMRLIDANKLIAEIQSMPDECRLFMYRKGKNIKKGLISIINRQSTAYDIDEVIEQLNDLVDIEYNRPENCDENGFGDGEDIYEDGRYQGKFEAYKNALKIVESNIIK